MRQAHVVVQIQDHCIKIRMWNFCLIYESSSDHPQMSVI